MSSKKRRSDIVQNKCPQENNGEKPTKRMWFMQENESKMVDSPCENTSGRKSWIGGLVRKFKSTSTLREKNRSSSQFDPVDKSLTAESSTISHNSESSVTSNESAAFPIAANVDKNLELKAFVNRESITPVPFSDDRVQRLANNEDGISISSGSYVSSLSVNLAPLREDDDFHSDRLSIQSLCTPYRGFHRGPDRMSTRSVPDEEVQQDSLSFRGLCNSAVRRTTTSSSDNDVHGYGHRRSMRMQLQRRNITLLSGMEDVPEEEPVVLRKSHLEKSIIEGDDDDEEFVNANEFFNQAGMQEPHDTPERTPGTTGHRKTPGSVTRRNSIWKSKLFGGKSRDSTPSALRTSLSQTDAAPETEEKQRRLSMTSVAEGTSSVLAKMRKRTPSTSSFSNRLSSVFRRSSTQDELDKLLSCGPAKQPRVRLERKSSSLRRRLEMAEAAEQAATTDGPVGQGTLSHVSSASSGVTINRSNLSRAESRREREAREKAQKFLDSISVSNKTALELVRAMRLRRDKSACSTSTPTVAKTTTSNPKDDEDDEEEEADITREDDDDETDAEVDGFDVVAIDVYPDGRPYSEVSALYLNESLTRRIAAENKQSLRFDCCGSMNDGPLDVIYVCPQSSSLHASMRDMNDTMSSEESLNPSFLPNVRNGVLKAIEVWNGAGKSENSKLLLFTMFCTKENECNSHHTVDSLFNMLEAILGTSKWKKGGKCVLAGVNEKNRDALKQKLEDMKLSLKLETEAAKEQVEEMTSLSPTSSIKITKL